MEPVNEYNFMTKYEKTRVLGLRALQISMGSPILVDKELLYNEINPLRIALIELRLRKLPFKVRRQLPNGEYIDVNVNDLIVQ